MSKEKQIEEMWNIMTTDCNEECVGCEFENDNWCFTHRVINNLYNAGYRKQSEVIEEFADKLGKQLYKNPTIFTQQRYIVVAEINRLVEEMKGGEEK